MSLPDLILVVCVVLVAVGAGLVYVPAGLMVGGVLGAGAVLAWARGADGEHGAERGE